MSEKTIVQKLMIKSGYSLLLVNPPPGYQENIGELPGGARILTHTIGSVEAIQVFVADRKELEAQIPQLKKLLKPGGMLWVTYHKGTSRVKTDINRDQINAYAATLGLTGVAMISIDENWSALRLKVT